MSAIRQNIDSLVNGFYQIGIRQWIVSPGSRNAPIVASLVKHAKFTLISQPDERAAGFLGLGANMAQVPTGIICTSGTAVLNYYPAICEAYYAQVPLLVVSADRPAELIDQWDGQTIRQNNVFKQHIKASYSINGNMHNQETFKELEEIVSKVHADLLTKDFGPVHINVPLEEPIYGDVESAWQAKEMEIKPVNWAEPKPVTVELPEGKNIVVFVGELSPQETQGLSLNSLSHQFPILTEACSNVKIENTDGWELFASKITNLPVPDVLITLGKNYVNKAFKQFIKANKNIRHYHLHTNLYVGNPFETDIQPILFAGNRNILKFLSKHKNLWTFNKSWINSLRTNEEKSEAAISLSPELEAIYTVFHANFSSIHIGNSTPIRMAGLLPKPEANLFCNRGTSGIDGCLSTAVGYALSKPKEKVACVLGDIAFLYDSNAPWCAPYPANLQIIVLNNGAGNIFNLIAGPGKYKPMLPYIKTPHQQSAKHIANRFGLSYSVNPNAIGSTTHIVEIFSPGNEKLWQFLSNF